MRSAPARVSARTVQIVGGVAVAPMVAVTMWLALTNEHLQRPVASASYRGYLTAASIVIGLYLWVRRPASVRGPCPR